MFSGINASRFERTCQGIVLVALLFCLPVISLGATRTWSGATSNVWGLGTNWTAGVAPTSSDSAVIPGGLATYPIITTAVTISTITINSSGSGGRITISTGGALTATGTVTVSANGSFIMTAGTAALTSLTCTNIINISGGTLTQTSNLTLNNGAVMTLSGGTVHMATNTSTNPTASIVIATGATLNQSGGTLYTRDYSVGAGTFNQTNSSALFRIFRSWRPGTGSVFNSTAGTVEFSGAPSSPDFATGTRQFSNIIVDSGVNPGFSTTANSTIPISGNFTNNSTTLSVTASATFTFNGSGSQTITSASTGSSTTFGNLVIAKSAGTVILLTNVAIRGNLTVTSGTYDLSTFTSNRSAAGGTITVSNNATLKIGGTNTFPTNYSTTSLVVASTVEYAGTNQTVASKAYGNLKFSSSSGAAVKTMPATALTVAGNLTSTLGAGSSVSFTAGAAISVLGSVSLGASTTFNGSTFSHTVGGNWSNSGTYSGSTGTVTFAGSSAAISGTGTQGFNNVTVTGTSVSFSNASITLTGNLTTSGSGSLIQASGGTFTMSGTTKTISGSGISIDNLTVTGTVTTSSTMIINGNLTVSGSFTTGSGSITMSGSSKTISGTGTKSFVQLIITGSVSTAADLSVSSGLTVNGSLSASAGTVTFTGTSTLSGTANLYDTVINGTSLQLATSSILGVGNTLTLTAGTLNVSSSSPNTVNFNGSGAQTINALTYNNLTLSGGNSKTAAAGITVNADLIIGSSTTFVPGAYTHHIYGDWTNSGTFSAGASNIEFLGLQPTDIMGAQTFNVLTVNKSLNSVEVIIHNDISVSTVEMTAGTFATGSNTITITTTRNGNGKILGNIKRSHSFTTGVAYAFEDPDNTITFASISGVSNITVSISEGGVADFPFGSAVNEEYTVTVPSGTYNATLRLDYEDDELNGNDESVMTLWNNNGSSWVNSGKSTNDASSNWVELDGLTNITNRWTLSNYSTGSNVVRWDGSTSTDWNTSGNWTVVQGSASRPPAAGDTVELGTVAFTYNPTISSAAVAKNINFGNAQAVTLSLGSGGSLTSGNIRGLWSGNATHTLNVNDRTVTVNGDLTLSDGTSGHVIDLNISTGTVTVSGSVNQTGGANIVFTGAGNLDLNHNLNHVSGTFTAGTGTVTYSGDSVQPIAAVTYNNLTINKTASVTITEPVTVGGDLLIRSGEVDNLSTFTISGNLTIASGAALHNHLYVHVHGDWTNNGSFNADATATMTFDGSGTQHISSSTFNNLHINKPVGSVAVLTGNVVVNSDLIVTSGTLDLENYSCNRSTAGGTFTLDNNATIMVDGSNLPSNFSTQAISNSSTINFDGGTSQTIPGGTFGNVIFSDVGTKTLSAPINVNGNLTIENGSTLDGGSQTLTLNGNWTNSGTFTPSTSTIVAAGTDKNLTGSTTFNNFTAVGSYTILNNDTFNGLLNVTSTGSLSGGSGITTTMNGDLLNSGTLYTLGTTTYSGTTLQTLRLVDAVSTVAVTVNFNGTVSPVLDSTSAPQFGYININNTGGVTASVGWTVLYAMTVGSGATFDGGISTHNFTGSLTNNGAITSEGVLNFIPATAKTIGLGSSFTSTGLVNFGGAGAITLTGSAANFNDLQISNTNAAGITPGSGWMIANDLNVGSGSTFNAGSYTHNIGGNISNNGTLNTSTSTFVMNGSDTQDIFSPSAFNNLTINKSAGVVSMSADTTVNGVLTFTAGKIQTDTFSLIQPSTGTVTGAAQGTGWVIGNFQKHIGTGSTSRSFEIGDPANYTPVVTNFASVSTAGDLTASVFGADHDSIGTSNIAPTLSVNRYWNLTNNGIVFSTYNAVFTFVAGDIDSGANTAAFIAAEYDGSTWTYPSIGTKTATSTEVSGITFGDFQIGEAPAPNVPLVNSVSPPGNQPPGTDLTYTVQFSNSGGKAAQSFVVTDPVPPNTDFKLGSASAALGSTGLTLTVMYSNDNGTTYTYTPVSAGGGAPAGYDRNVSSVRWVFSGNLGQTSPNNVGSISFVVQIR
ncbi:MAG: hypothetical protein ABL959_02040 [Pyrinomonadaceae bacterium]